MTAATWKQARKIAGCACPRPGKVECAIEQGHAAQYCLCPCHFYMRVDPGPQCDQSKGEKNQCTDAPGVERQ